jgi:hypothetical protein
VSGLVAPPPVGTEGAADDPGAGIWAAGTLGSGGVGDAAGAACAHADELADAAKSRAIRADASTGGRPIGGQHIFVEAPLRDLRTEFIQGCR